MNSRQKGVSFEREVAEAFEAAGYEVRHVDPRGDLIAVKDGEIEQVECKRTERLKIPENLRQLRRDAIPGARQVLVFKQSRQPAYAVVPFDQYLEGLR